jgi:hypothetical protein
LPSGYKQPPPWKRDVVRIIKRPHPEDVPEDDTELRDAIAEALKAKPAIPRIRELFPTVRGLGVGFNKGAAAYLSTAAVLPGPVRGPLAAHGDDRRDATPTASTDDDGGVEHDLGETPPARPASLLARDLVASIEAAG